VTDTGLVVSPYYWGESETRRLGVLIVMRFWLFFWSVVVLYFASQEILKNTKPRDNQDSNITLYCDSSRVSWCREREWDKEIGASWKSMNFDFCCGVWLFHTVSTNRFQKPQKPWIFRIDKSRPRTDTCLPCVVGWRVRTWSVGKKGRLNRYFSREAYGIHHH
jgi:hypothetical protein